MTLSASSIAIAHLAADPELLRRYQVLYHQVQEQAHTLEDLLEGRATVDVEGDGGKDVFRAKQLGLFTCNVKGVDIIAKCEADAAPLIHYLEQGGVYGSLDFSRLLGYSEEQVQQYAELLKLQAKLGLSPWGYRKASKLLGVPHHRQETDWSCGAATVRSVLLYFGHDVPESKLRNELGSTPKDGTAIKPMVDWMNNTGWVQAEARKMVVEDLKNHVDQGNAVIVDLQAWGDKTDYSNEWDDGHYVVLNGYDDATLYFTDPASDDMTVTLPIKELDARWHDVGTTGHMNHMGIVVTNRPLPNKVAARWLGASHGKNVALMKFLSDVSKRLGFGEHVYVVGGAVRNWVIDQPIKDIDLLVDTVALKHSSEWVAQQIAKSVPVETNLTTNQYGVAILTVKGDWNLDGHQMDGEVIEIAAARKESYGGEEGKGYKPHTVEPATVQEDVLRREFTFNTLMWRLMDLSQGPEKAQIIDLTGCGLSDLQEGKMQCPADPDTVFSDDPSRLIRLVKFVTRYGFKLTPDTEAAAKRQAPKLAKVPHNAVSKLLTEVLVESKAKQAIALMDHLGLLDVVRGMVENIPAFREALNNWGNSQSVQYMFSLMDIGLVTKAKVGFLPPNQQSKVRDIAAHMGANEAEHFLAVLKQPGKVLDVTGIAKDFGLVGAAMKGLMEMSRETLLSNPDLITNPTKWEAVVRAELGFPKAQRVASRYLTAGVLEAPPAMVKGIGEWIMAVAAATYIDQISNATVAVEANPYLYLQQSFATLRQALATGKISAITKAYKDAILYADAGFSREQFKRPDPKILQGLDPAVVDQRLKGWMSAIEAVITSRIGGRSALDDERIEVLKRHLMSGVGPATNAEAVRVFPIDTTGWKYDGPALLKMIQDRFVSFTQKEIDFEQRRKTPDPESLSILQAELARTLMGDFPNSKITVKVSLRGEGAKVRGKWSSASQMLIVTVPPMQRLEVRGIKGVTDELYGTLRHELQHMAQWLIRLAVMDTMSHIDAKRQTIPSPGMPSKKIMTPQWRQQQGDDVDDESHAMDDLEFFTRLKDAIKAAQRGLAEQSKRIQSAQKRPASVAEQQQFLLAFLGEKRDPNVEPNTSFVTWKRMAKGKWKRAIKEFFAAFPILARAPSAPRVASRYLMAAEGKYDHINFKPPESVANAAKKGLEYRQKASPSNKGGLTVSEAAKQGIGSGVQRAVNLKNRDEVSPETIGKMVAFFSRHEKNKGIAPEHKSEPWNDKGHVAWLLWGGDPGRTWAEKVKGQMEAADKKKSASRVAQRYLEAGVTDWLKWIVQPFAVLAKHHREFVYGPVDDAFDAVIKELAPKLVRELTEKEVESDVDDFLRGALAGRDGKPLSSSESADFRAGYVWGKVNKDDKDLQRGDLPAYMKRQVIQSSVAEFRKRITETVLKDALKKAWHAINPMTTFNAIKSAVKKHGWKLGVGFALFELFEHFVLPAVLSTLFDDPRLLSLATLPIGEVVYAVMFRILGRTPAEVNKADEAGHLDWYEQEFGPIRLAALPS